ncbi:MAG: hypothetical protein F4Z82_09515 [Caldilineaceae bacterium SB0668_bin_21]|nr:hypothetical protein [Caldilineaceae bacterium SB0668_bin_21]
MTSTRSRQCPGLPAEWVNGWLAAVGATVLDPRMRLSWTPSPSPVAVLHHPTVDPAEALSTAWPHADRIQDMPLARNHGCFPPLERLVDASSLSARIRGTHRHPDAWTLTSSLTDLETDDKGMACHAPLDPAGPGTIKWLHHRLTKIHERVSTDPDTIAAEVSKTLKGIATPVPDNGLGFDIGRLPDRASIGQRVWTHPVVEVLAFFGMALLPTRGDGVRGRFPNTRQRGHRVAGYRGLLWCAWSQSLDRWAIDALLDAWHHSWRPTSTGDWVSTASDWNRLGVHSAWHSTPYAKAGSSDNTRGFNSEPITPSQRPAASLRPLS